jgi:glycosyltransferase involved in cell wall biosynthesis
MDLEEESCYRMTRPSCVCIPMLAISNHGGIRVLIQIANRLAHDGKKVKIICPKGTIKTIYDIHEAIEIREIGFGCRVKVVGWLIFCAYAIFHMKKNAIIANHFVTFFPAAACKALFPGTTLVYFLQGMEFKAYSQPLRWIAQALCVISYRCSNIVAANPYLHQAVRQYNSGAGFMRLGIAEKFIQREARFNGKKYDLIYFLRHESYKRIDRFDRLLPRFRDAGMLILGVSQNDILLEKYSAMVSAVRKPKSDDDLIDCLDSAKLLLLTSDHEGFSLPPLEGMARGVVPVMYECGGPSNYAVNGGNAQIVAPDDDDEILAQVIRLLSDQECRQKMSRSGMLTAGRFVFDKEIKTFEKVYLYGKAHAAPSARRSLARGLQRRHMDS